MPAPPNLSLNRPPFALDTNRLDQHLTISANVIQQLLRAAELHSTDTVLDIGAGTGLITRALTERVHQVIAVEIDERFTPYLRHLHGRGITVYWGDLRTIAPPQTTVVVANPPFGSTEHLTDYLSQLPRLRRAALIVGRRFARTATAQPGTGAYSRLSLHVQAAFAAHAVTTIPPTDFFPPARTPAAILTLTPAAPDPLVQALDRAFTASAGTRLSELIRSLHRSGLLEDPRSFREQYRLVLNKRLQELTNVQISHVARALRH